MKALRSVHFLFCFAICGCLIFSVSRLCGVLFLSSLFFLIFKGRYSVFALCIYLFFQFCTLNSFFVIDSNIYKGNPLILTTKGYINSKFAAGDLVTGKFTYKRAKHNWQLEKLENVKYFRIPLISYLLKKRTEHARMLNYRSGTKINITQAHIFAIRSYIPDILRDEYTITGLAHLLAMSGFHVVIFSAGIFLLFSFMPIKVRIFPVLLLLPMLIPLSGFTITVIRAVIFSWFFLLAWLLDIKIKPIPFVEFVAAMLLTIMPETFYSISFWLSFGAVFGIAAIFDYGKTPLISMVLIGIASSVFTLPLQLYYFGTANLLSVLTTVVMTPVVWIQMILGIASLLMPQYIIVPLSMVEDFGSFLMQHLYELSWHFLCLSKPHTWILVLSTALAFAACFTKFKYLSLFMLIIPFLPIYPSGLLIFPKLPASQKGYVLKYAGGSEIFFQGTRSNFVYKMLPVIARLGIKEFDFGSIEIIDGKNLYLRINNKDFSGLVCINNDECPYAYYTKSNILKAPLDKSVINYVVYNSKIHDERILTQKDKGELIFKLF